MLFTIQNKYMSVSVNSHGAELWSIKNKDGLEYLWQGDPAYWSDRSPNLFPYIGRMINKRYSYAGKTYTMDIHGFALASHFDLMSQSESHLVFRLCSSECTKLQYPWNFSYTISYHLQEWSLEITFGVENKDSKPMLFAVGGHPGFFVPLSKNEAFEDYRLRFVDACSPKRVVFTEDCLVDTMIPYYFDENNSISLRHDLFDNDAIVLKDTGKKVILENPNGKHSVTVSFPDMEYIGFWHEVKTEAPYVCIEPWSSLPSAKGDLTIWENQKDLLTLDPGEKYENKWEISIN